MMDETNNQNVEACKYLKQLQQINRQLNIRSISTNELQQLLRRYTNLYIQNHGLSEQFFISLCEHNILAKLFTNLDKNLSPLFILEMFHLIISNTSMTGELIYIFSQPITHEYLFQKINIYKQNSQAIEYYVQLLKSIIIKISAESHLSLIKLFCNKRFPSFPLLTVVTILGTCTSNQILVKITAQQCVLLLINLINTTKIGLVYLNELQMIVFYYELTKELFSQTNNDREGLMKYLIDLIAAIKINSTSICLLMNTLVNNLYFKNIARPHKILEFLIDFRQQIIEYNQLSEDQSESMMNTFYSIFSKYYCNKYINFTYFSAQKIIPEIQTSNQPNLIKFYHERSQKIDQYLINEEQYYENQKQIALVFDQWKYFNQNNPSTTPSKIRKSSVKNRFSEIFTKADKGCQQYLRNAMTMAGLQLQKLQNPISKLSWSSNFKTSLYLVEYVCIKHPQQSHHQQYCRDDCWQLIPNFQFFYQIYRLLELMDKNGVSHFNKDSFILVFQMDGQLQFIQKMRKRLLMMVIGLLCEQQAKLSINLLTLITRISYKLRFRQLIQPFIMKKLQIRMQQIYKIIIQDLFQDDKFQYFFRFVSKNKVKRFLKQKPSKNSNEVKGEKTKYKIQGILFLYEVIRLLIDSSLKSMSQFFDDFWRMNFGLNDSKEKQKFRNLMAYKDCENNIIKVIATESYAFQVKIQSKQEITHKFNLSDKDFVFFNQQSPRLQFQEYQGITMLNVEKANNFRKDIQEIRQQRKEVLRNSIMEYLSLTFETIHVKSMSTLESTFITPK